MGSSSKAPQLRRLVAVVYSAHTGKRHPVFSGPLWLGLALTGAIVAVTILGGNPWSALFVPVLLLLAWIPRAARWAFAARDAARAFRDELNER